MTRRSVSQIVGMCHELHACLPLSLLQQIMLPVTHSEMLALRFFAGEFDGYLKPPLRKYMLVRLIEMPSDADQTEPTFGEMKRAWQEHRNAR